VGNLTHVFLEDGLRVQFDRRDDSVTLYKDAGFTDPSHIGYAKRSGSGWSLTGIGSASLGYATSCKAAAEKLAAAAQPRLDAYAQRRAAERDALNAATERVVAIIRRADPSFRPRYFGMEQTGQQLSLDSDELLEVLRAVARTGTAALGADDVPTTDPDADDEAGIDEDAIPLADAHWELHTDEGSAEAWAYGEQYAWRILPPLHADASDARRWLVLRLTEDGVDDETELSFGELLDRLPVRVWPWARSAAQTVAAERLQNAYEALAEWDGGPSAVPETARWAGDEIDLAHGVLNELQVARAQAGDQADWLDAPAPAGRWRTAPEMLDQLAAAMREHFALDPDDPRDADAVAALAAIGLTNGMWRNSPLEDAHAGSRRDELSDEAMMLHNIATTEQLRSYVTATTIALDEIEAVLLDPDRPLAADATARGLLRRHWDRYVEHVREQVELLRGNAESVGEPAVVWRLSAHGGLACQHWYGTPWWADTVAEFEERLAANPGALPAPDVVERLRERPLELTLDEIGWLQGRGLRFPAGDTGRQRFVKRRAAG